MLPVAIFSRSNAYGGRSDELADRSIVGWNGPYPALSRKRPTASLVSRKVLTPLLGQVLLCIAIQFMGFEFVQRQTWLARRHPGGGLLLLTSAKVYSSTAGHPKVQHKEFGEHNSFPDILFSVHILWDCA